MKSARIYHNKSVQKAPEQVSLPGDIPAGKSDLALWQAFKKGNENAYAEIYKVYAPVLYKYGTRFVNRPALVKDCIQEVFIDLWDGRENLGEVKSIKAYLFKVIRRKIVGLIKEKPYLNASDCHIPFDMAYSPERMLGEHQLRQDQLESLEKALTRLTKKQREIIYLKFHKQLSYDEIAEVMDITKKAAYKKMGRALDTLRQLTGKLSLLILTIASLF